MLTMSYNNVHILQIRNGKINKTLQNILAFNIKTQIEFNEQKLSSQCRFIEFNFFFSLYRVQFFRMIFILFTWNFHTLMMTILYMYTLYVSFSVAECLKQCHFHHNCISCMIVIDVNSNFISVSFSFSFHFVFSFWDSIMRSRIKWNKWESQQ